MNLGVVRKMGFHWGSQNHEKTRIVSLRECLDFALSGMLWPVALNDHGND